ncbi:SEC3 [Candida pseudojiufengensis]|uniref:SEC3 n=1 Tax=Candida pseudojiufengensis TaxID=497109 RepID=UPI0022244ED4|nr:SEC3 [Candida pseudojiufengensis]KAI5965801.1 SEC3 [Candida pseudojiufengensis]
MFKSPSKSKNKQPSQQQSQQLPQTQPNYRQHQSRSSIDQTRQQPYINTTSDRNASSYSTNQGSASPLRHSFNLMDQSNYSNNSRPLSPSQNSQHSNSEQQRKQTTDKIIYDCYSKRSANGAPEISYIAHIGIQEFSHFPSQQPPPSSDPGPIKKRILVLCKKQSGRLQLQKGKYADEKNVFQIGRTWDLTELSAITRSGFDGFTLSLNKDYYWKCDEDDSRIWKFVRYLCQSYGEANGRYPILNGYKLDDLMLTATPKMSPAQASSPTFNSFAQSPTRQQIQQQPLQQQPPLSSPDKKKSLKQKLTKPSIFSHDKSHNKDVSPTPASVASSSASTHSHKKSLSGSKIYKDMDFTSNGQLPQKPMRVIQRDASITTSSPSIHSSIHQDHQSFNSHQSKEQSKHESSQSAKSVPISQNDAYSQRQRDSGSNKTPEPQRSEFTNNLPTKEKSQHPYQVRSMIPDDQRSVNSDANSFVFGSSDLSNKEKDSKFQPMKPLEENKSSFNHKHQNSTTSQRSGEEIIQEFSQSIPSQQQQPKKPKMAASAFSPDFGIEEITDESDNETKPGKGNFIKKNSNPSSIKNKSTSQTDIAAKTHSRQSSEVGINKNPYANNNNYDVEITKNPYASNINETSRRPSEFDNKNPYTKSAFGEEKGLGIQSANSSAFIEESTKIQLPMQELNDMIDNHIASGSKKDESFDFDDNFVDLNEVESPQLRTKSTTSINREIKPSISKVPSISSKAVVDNSSTNFENEPELKISRKKSTQPSSSIPKLPTSAPTLSNFEKDFETEEMFKEIGWNPKMNANSLLKNLNKELNKTKQETVKKLVNIDLTTTSANDTVIASNEILNMLHIFQKMDIGFKMLNNNVQIIDKDSKGLQTKYLNKKLLYNDLQSILSKISIDNKDLNDISEFKNFDHISLIGNLEIKLSHLYNAIVTIRSDSHSNNNEDLSSLKALQQYKLKYENVNQKFVQNFTTFIINKITQIGKNLMNNLDQFSSNIIYKSLVQLLVYSGLTYYIKEIGWTQFNEIKQHFNQTFASVLIRMLFTKVQNIKMAQKSHSYSSGSNLNSEIDELPTTPLQSSGSQFNKSSSRRRSDRTSMSPGLSNSLDDLYDEDGLDDDFAPLRKSRGSRYSRKGSSRYGGANSSSSGTFTSEREDDLKRKQNIESIKRHILSRGSNNEDELEDSKSIIGLIEESKTIIMVLQYFFALFFHYDVNSLDFIEFLHQSPFTKRDEYASKSNPITINEFIDDKNVNYNVSQEVLENLNFVFGKFIFEFLKIVTPIDLNLPLILLNLEDSINHVQNNFINQEFLIYNFLNKINEKYQTQWFKFISIQVDAINNSIIIPNSGILPSIKNINYLILITESSIDNRDIKGTKIREIIDKSYDKISNSLIQLFNRIDPLTSKSSIDQQDLQIKNVSILENIFVILQQINEINSYNQATNKLIEKLTSIFNKIESQYFQKLIQKNFGPLIEFINNEGDNNKRQQKSNHHIHRPHFNHQKSSTKLLLQNYSESEISLKIENLHNKISKQFKKSYENNSKGISGNDNLFTRDLIDKIWIDLENLFIDYFTKLSKILRSDIEKDYNYSVGRQDIHHIFKSIRG